MHKTIKMSLLTTATNPLLFALRIPMCAALGQRSDCVGNDAGILLNVLNKVLGVFPADGLNAADFPFVEEYTVKLVGLRQHFRSEGGRNELRIGRKLVNHGYPVGNR